MAIARIPYGTHRPQSCKTAFYRMRCDCRLCRCCLTTALTSLMQQFLTVLTGGSWYATMVQQGRRAHSPRSCSDSATGLRWVKSCAS